MESRGCRQRRSFAGSLAAHGVVLALAWRYARTPPPAFDSPGAPGLDLVWFDAPPPPHRHPPSRLERPEPSVAPAAVVAPERASRLAPTRAHDELSQPPTALAPPSPFLTWRPGEAHSLSDTAPTASAGTSAFRALDTAPLPPGEAAPADSAEQPGAGLRSATVDYFTDALDEAAPRQIPGSQPYFARLARAASHVWRPINAHTPSLGEALVRTFFTDTATAQAIMQRSLGPLASGRGAAMIAALDAAHPNSPIPAPAVTMSARAAATEHVTSVRIELDQDAQGRVIAARVVRRSGVAGFDTAALEAIQRAAADERPEHARGIWRSRWSLDVVASRDPFVTAVPGAGGEAPSFVLAGEVEFDEVTGVSELHLPGMLHVRRRVRLLSSREIRGPVAEPTHERERR